MCELPPPRCHRRRFARRPGFKSKTHFGQLPHAEIAGVGPVSQSGAIVRVLARKAGLEGKTDADFALSEMLIEECKDLYADAGKAMYPKDGAEGRPAAFADFFSESGAANKHLGFLEKLIGASGRFTSAPTTGEVAVVAVISILKDLKPAAELLASHPKLAAFYGARAEAADKALANLGTYFKTTA